MLFMCVRSSSASLLGDPYRASFSSAGFLSPRISFFAFFWGVACLVLGCGCYSFWSKFNNITCFCFFQCMCVKANCAIDDLRF